MEQNILYVVTKSHKQSEEHGTEHYAKIFILESDASEYFTKTVDEILMYWFKHYGFDGVEIQKDEVDFSILRRYTNTWDSVNFDEKHFDNDCVVFEYAE